MNSEHDPRLGLTAENLASIADWLDLLDDMLDGLAGEWLKDPTLQGRAQALKKARGADRAEIQRDLRGIVAALNGGGRRRDPAGSRQ